MNDMIFQNQQLMDQRIHEQNQFQQQNDSYIHAAYGFQQAQQNISHIAQSISVSDLKNTVKKACTEINNVTDISVNYSNTIENGNPSIKFIAKRCSVDPESDKYSKKLMFFVLGITLITVIGIIIAVIIYLKSGYR